MEQQQQQQQASSASVSGRNETDALSNDFDSIALAGQLDNDRPSALAGLGDPNGLSTRVPPGVAAACTQILSAALPSFIPSMVAPLVCVFSYQTPSISDLASIPYTSYPRPDASSSPSSSNNKVEEPARKEFVYPWGHPNEPPPPTFQSFPLTQTQTQTQTKNQTQSPSSPSPSSSSTTPSSPNDKSRKYHRRHQKQQSLPGAPDSGIVVVHSKTWTQHEREALYLAATRFRLSGQWSKIREMMNLHRTDKEIETEYKKLYAHRENENDFDDDEDEDYHYDATTSVIDALSHQDQFSNSNANSDNDADVDDIDDDDDEETEKVIFMKFGGGLRSAQQRRQQLQHQQSRRLHYDQLHFQQQPVPQQELQHHHQHQHQQQQLQFQQQQEQQQEQQHQGSNSTFNVPPLHDNYYQQLQQQQQPQQSLLTDSDPIRIYKKEFMIDKRFALEEIPMRI
ncbi:hypothetical protein EC991_009421 [Linnemannia zychae]|nr:hypothetical protein EC991_009421 [Linnemannia zychae]